MDSRDGTPPYKRRRTSRDPSQDSSRRHSQLHDLNRNGDETYDRGKNEAKIQYSSSPSSSRSRSRDRYSPRRDSYHLHQRTPSDEYATPRSRNESPPPQTTPKTKLSFAPLVALPHVHARGITSTKFSPDCSLLATGSGDGTINIYAVPRAPKPDTSFTLLRTLRGHLSGINALSWSPSGGPNYTLASASDDKSILLWSPISSDFPIAPSPLTGHHNYVYSLAFSPKGNMLVSGSHDEAVYLWDVRSGRIMRQLPAHSDPVAGVDFVRDGTMVVSCAGDGLIRIWDAATGQCLKTLVHEDRKAVTAVRFSPNGRYVLAWTLDGSVRLWRYMGPGGDCVKTYTGHVNERYALSGTIGEYYTSDEDEEDDDDDDDDEEEDESNDIKPMQRRRLEAFVATGSEDGSIVVWDINSKAELWRASSAHKGVVLAVDWARSADGTGLLASVGQDRSLKVWMESSAEDEEQIARNEAGGLEREMIKMEIEQQEENGQNEAEEMVE